MSLRWSRLPSLVALSVVLALPVGVLAGRPDLLARALIRDEPVVAVDAVFVASGDVDFHRTRHGAKVFEEVRARWFVVSGAGAGGDNGGLMADAAVSFGIPREAIVVETRATTTRENAVFTRPLLPADVRSIAVVTDPLHSRRLAWTAEHAWPGIRVVSATVPQGDGCTPEMMRTSARCRHAVATEWKKLAGYFVRGWLF